MDIPGTHALARWLIRSVELHQRGGSVVEDRIEASVSAFEHRISAVREGVQSCLDEFVAVTDEDVRFLIAERLPSLGSAALPGVVDIIDNSPAGSDLRYLAAWVALVLGDRGSAVSALCVEVDSASKWSLPAANALARAHVQEGKPSILRALERLDPADGRTTLQWTTALRGVGGTLPGDLKGRLIGAIEPWAARVIRQDFPD
jgi:hypothetical protein